MYFTALVLFVLSLVLLLVGANTFYHFSSYTSVLNYHLLSPAGVTIFFGLALINLSFLGLLGVFCRSFLLLSLFQLLLFLLLVFELLIGIILATLRYGIYPPIATAMLNSEEHYNGNPAVAHAWNEIHSRFSCCGTSHYNEWHPFFGNGTVPDSCCVNYYAGCGHLAVNLTNIYNTGCIATIRIWLYRNDIIFTILFLSFIAFQTLSILVTRRYLKNQDQHGILREIN